METIFSLVTKEISQNVAIIRISGDETFKLLRKIFGTNFKEGGNEIEFRKMNYKGEFVDEVLLLKFKSPNSFTGEDVVEIQFHGSIFLVEKISSIIKENGIRQANPGEFTMRAVMNGKLNLSQANSINQLIKSNSRQLAKASSNNLNLGLSKKIKSFQEKFLNLLSVLQISIDYPEVTDIKKYSKKEVMNILKKLRNEFSKIIEDSEKIQIIDEGISLLLIGVPNSGKSTLFNKILNKERSIVSNLEGTTRDVIDAQILVSGVKFNIKDTAGIRDAKSQVEKKGIENVYKEIENAVFLFVILTPELDIKEQIKKFDKIKGRKVFVLNKSDLLEKIDIKRNKNIDLVISAKNDEISPLINKMSEIAKSNFDIDYKNSFLISNNELSLFKDILSSLEEVIEMISIGHTIDVITFEIEEIIKSLGKVLGIEIDSDYFISVFKNFCIGK